MRPISRGDIFWSNAFADTGLHKNRMVLVIQNNMGNRYSEYVIVVPIRHETEKNLPIYVSLMPGIAGITKDSVVDCGHIGTFLKTKLQDYVGHLPELQMHRVNNVLKVSLALT